MTPAQRIAAIRESATLLSQQSWHDIDLILQQHEMATSSPKPGDDRDDRYSYIINSISYESNDALYTLYQYLIGESDDVPTEVQPWSQGQLKLFMSHLAERQEFVDKVGAHLSHSGISCFVAHVSIEPSEEWQSVIEGALRSCDAMAVFLHKGFHESDWCDQEVGFALARRVPVLPIAINVMPYGFMGKLQAARCQPNEDYWKVGRKVFDWLARTPSAQTALTEALVTAFEQSGSYDDTRWVYEDLENMPVFTPLQLQRLETATKNNSQVREAQLHSHRIPDLVRNLINDRGGTLASPPSKYSDEPPF
jgi:hypothetical protein